jgi:hypothetical protein
VNGPVNNGWQDWENAIADVAECSVLGDDGMIPERVFRPCVLAGSEAVSADPVRRFIVLAFRCNKAVTTVERGR